MAVALLQKNIHLLKKITHIDGFLIGGASIDFQELKHIITAE